MVRGKATNSSTIPVNRGPESEFSVTFRNICQGGKKREFGLDIPTLRKYIMTLYLKTWSSINTKVYAHSDHNYMKYVCIWTKAGGSEPKNEDRCYAWVGT